MNHHEYFDVVAPPHSSWLLLLLMGTKVVRLVFRPPHDHHEMLPVECSLHYQKKSMAQAHYPVLLLLLVCILLVEPKLWRKRCCRTIVDHDRSMDVDFASWSSAKLSLSEGGTIQMNARRQDVVAEIVSRFCFDAVPFQVGGNDVM